MSYYDYGPIDPYDDRGSEYFTSDDMSVGPSMRGKTRDEFLGRCEPLHPYDRFVRERHAQYERTFYTRCGRPY